MVSTLLSFITSFWFVFSTAFASFFASAALASGAAVVRSAVVRSAVVRSAVVRSAVPRIVDIDKRCVC